MTQKGRSYTNSKPRVLSFLGVGKENGIKQADLCEKMHCDPSELKADVQRTRRNCKDYSQYICSDRDGYYIAKDKRELSAFVSKEKKQAMSRIKTIEVAERMLNEMEGQVSFDGMGE